MAALLLSACAHNPTTPSTPDETLAWLRTAQDIHGNAIEVPTPAPRGTVVLAFASWCIPCQQDIAHMESLQQQHPGLHVIGLNVHEDWKNLSSRTALENFLTAQAPWLPVVQATEEALAALGTVPKIPSLFLFDAEGNFAQALRSQQGAPLTQARVAAAVDDLLRHKVK